MPDDDTMITIRHEDGNTLRGTVEQVLGSHLAKGWKLTEGPQRRVPETERPAELDPGIATDFLSGMRPVADVLKKRGQPREGDTLESLIRAMVPIKHEPLATNVVNEWLERIRAVLDAEAVWEYAIKLPAKRGDLKDRYTTADPESELPIMRKRLASYHEWAPDAVLVRRRAHTEWEEIA